MGIRVVADLPAVGDNLQDHVAATITFEPSVRSAPRSQRYQVVLSARSKDWREPRPDTHVVLGSARPGEGVALFSALLAPRSRGRVELRSTNPLEAPRITTGFLEDGYDLERLTEGLVLAHELASCPAIEAVPAVAGVTRTPGRRR